MAPPTSAPARRGAPGRRPDAAARWPGYPAPARPAVRGAARAPLRPGPSRAIPGLSGWTGAAGARRRALAPVGRRAAPCCGGGR